MHAVLPIRHVLQHRSHPAGREGPTLCGLVCLVNTQLHSRWCAVLILAHPLYGCCCGYEFLALTLMRRCCCWQVNELLDAIRAAAAEPRVGHLPKEQPTGTIAEMWLSSLQASGLTLTDATPGTTRLQQQLSSTGSSCQCTNGTRAHAQGAQWAGPEWACAFCRQRLDECLLRHSSRRVMACDSVATQAGGPWNMADHWYCHGAEGCGNACRCHSLSRLDGFPGGLWCMPVCVNNRDILVRYIGRQVGRSQLHQMNR